MKKLKLKKVTDLIDSFNVSNREEFIKKNAEFMTEYVPQYFTGRLLKTEIIEKAFNMQDNRDEGIMAVILTVLALKELEDNPMALIPFLLDEKKK